MIGLAAVLGAFSLAGIGQAIAGAVLARRFARTAGGPATCTEPITILKPLHGAEPLLVEALTTLCTQDYPPGFQIVFGAGDPSDAACQAVEVLRRRFPDADIALIIDGATHGSNPKVGNLINMLPAARHDILVIADSDVHARPDYLRHIAAALARPSVGLVTTLYAGLPAFRCLAGRLGATQITHGFLPGALLARALGRRDCLGATMALRREVLDRIGGLDALKNRLADDNVLGQLVRAAGLEIALAGTVVTTTVPERDLGALWRHELRWARTIRTLAPLGFAASLLQYPLFFACLTLIAAPAAWGFALACWVARALAAVIVDRAMGQMLGGLAFPAPLWLLPLRDLLSAAEWIASHMGREVDWRGLSLTADTPPRYSQTGLNKGSNAR